MAITNRNTFKRTHRLEKDQFELNPHNPHDMAAKANADKAVLNGDDDKAVSILSLNNSTKIVDTTPATPIATPTVEMKLGRTVKKVDVNLIKLYQDDGWTLC